MKKKKSIIIVIVAVVIVAAAIMITTPFKWSEKSFEAIVQEIVTQPDGEIRLIESQNAQVF